MKNSKNANRRVFMGKLAKGLVLGTAASLFIPSKVSAMRDNTNVSNVYAMWAHGSEGKLEGVFNNGQDSISLATKMVNKMRSFHSAGYARSFVGSRMPGNTISLKGEAAATMIPTSGGAQLTIWDRGSKAKAKNGEFWIHYTIPTPAIANSVRVKASKILIKCASTDANFYITDVELWDANKRIYNKSGQKLWGPDKMHGFSFGTPRTVRYGLCLSLKIKGERVSADRIFEISGVGVDLIA